MLDTIEIRVSEEPGATQRVKNDLMIAALTSSDLVGYLRLEVLEDADMTWFGEEGTISQLIYLAYVTTLDDYQKQGVATELYKEFGRLYSEKYEGWKVAHMFTNPVAEYMFRKAVADGHIPVGAYNEELFFYDDIEEEYGDIWKELHQKLPDQFKGSLATWTYDE